MSKIEKKKVVTYSDGWNYVRVCEECASALKKRYLWLRSETRGELCYVSHVAHLDRCDVCAAGGGKKIEYGSGVPLRLGIAYVA